MVYAIVIAIRKEIDMGWLDDLVGITDDVLSTVTKPVKTITGGLKDIIDDICDDD